MFEVRVSQRQLPHDGQRADPQRGPDPSPAAVPQEGAAVPPGSRPSPRSGREEATDLRQQHRLAAWPRSADRPRTAPPAPPAKRPPGGPHPRRAAGRRPPPDGAASPLSHRRRVRAPAVGGPGSSPGGLAHRIQSQRRATGAFLAQAPRDTRAVHAKARTAGHGAGCPAVLAECENPTSARPRDGGPLQARRNPQGHTSPASASHHVGASPKPGARPGENRRSAGPRPVSGGPTPGSGPRGDREPLGRRTARHPPSSPSRRRAARRRRTPHRRRRGHGQGSRDESPTQARRSGEAAGCRTRARTPAGSRIRMRPPGPGIRSLPASTSCRRAIVGPDARCDPREHGLHRLRAGVSRRRRPPSGEFATTRRAELGRRRWPHPGRSSVGGTSGALGRSMVPSVPRLWASRSRWPRGAPPCSTSPSQGGAAESRATGHLRRNRDAGKSAHAKCHAGAVGITHRHSRDRAPLDGELERL